MPFPNQNMLPQVPYDANGLLNFNPPMQTSLQTLIPQQQMPFASNNHTMFPSPVGSSGSADYRENENMIKKVNVGCLNVETSIASRKACFKWPMPNTKQPVKFTAEAFSPCSGYKSRKEISNQFPFKIFVFNTIPGKLYRVHIKCLSLDDRFLVAEWMKEFRAEMSHHEVDSLYSKCYLFLNSIPIEYQMQEIQYIYRCKPKIYWDQIYDYSDNVMQKYIKDDNGQPGNLINGKIKGLFFSALVDRNGDMPNKSYFGNVRMHCDAYMFLNTIDHQLYFADFYCNKTKHYATIVICVINSETDEYCRNKGLVKLDPLLNPFIRACPPRDGANRWKFLLNKNILVELFYTEDVNLNVGQFSEVEATGAGMSKTNGVPNNKECSVCNLYPEKK